MSSQPPLLELDDVEVHFQNGGQLLGFIGEEPETVRAVDGVSLTLEEQDVLSLVGESGCGKTTLGKTAIGLQKPTGGSVKFRGNDIWEVKKGNVPGVEWDDIRTSLQIIHQDPGSSLNPNRQIQNILMVPLKQTHPNLGRNDRLERIYALLERVGMTPAADFAERYPHQLSGGEQQRVALTRALLMNPDVILADEAISALDVSLRVEMMDLMLELQEDFDTSYIFISHDLSNARYFSAHGGGKIGVMYLGEMAERGPAERMINEPQHPYTKVLRWATPDLSLREAGEPPMRKIDIPDPVNPPSGCRFHTRCPEAREACTKQNPPVYEDDGQFVSCFRMDRSHEYWSSTELTDGELEANDLGESGSADAD